VGADDTGVGSAEMDLQLTTGIPEPCGAPSPPLQSPQGDQALRTCVAALSSLSISFKDSFIALFDLWRTYHFGGGRASMHDDWDWMNAQLLAGGARMTFKFVRWYLSAVFYVVVYLVCYLPTCFVRTATQAERFEG
jgi:hypothetical protein